MSTVHSELLDTLIENTESDKQRVKRIKKLLFSEDIKRRSNNKRRKKNGRKNNRKI